VVAGWHAHSVRATLDDPRQMHQGTDIVEIELSSGSQTIRAEDSGFGHLVYAPDGTLHAIGSTTPEFPGLTSLWSLGEVSEDLTGHTDRSIFSFLLPAEMAIPQWTDDGFYVGFVDGGGFDSCGLPAMKWNRCSRGTDMSPVSQEAQTIPSISRQPMRQTPESCSSKTRTAQNVR